MLTVPFASDRTSASAHALLPALTYRYVSFLNGTTLTPVVNENLRERIPDGQKRRELPLGFETRLFLKFRNREGNVHKDASRSGSQ